MKDDHLQYPFDLFFIENDISMIFDYFDSLNINEEEKAHNYTGPSSKQKEGNA